MLKFVEMKATLRLLLVGLLGASIVRASPMVKPALHEAIVIDPDTDPLLVAQCFNYYLPILNEIASTFSVQYQACISLAAEQTTELSAQATQNQSSIMGQTESMCTALETCGNASQIVDSLNCYANALSQDVSAMYDLSTEATLSAHTFNQGLLAIQNNEAECANDTQNTYVTNTALTYAKLNECFLSGLPSTAEPVETTTSGP